MVNKTYGQKINLLQDVQKMYMCYQYNSNTCMYFCWNWRLKSIHSPDMWMIHNKQVFFSSDGQQFHHYQQKRSLYNNILIKINDLNFTSPDKEYRNKLFKFLEN
jgi:hypothetical protein